MGPVLEGLIKLQSVENRLRTAKIKLSRCRRSVILQEKTVRSLQSNLESKLEEIQLSRLHADRLELELKSREEHIAKYRAALNTAKTNKEYAAILTELNTSKADNSKLENQILELMKNIDSDESDCTQIKEQINEEKTRLEEVRSESESKSVEFEKEIAEIQTEWDQESKNIPAESLNTFKRVAETYDGEAIAKVEQQDSRSDSFTCGGCYMGLTAETVNQLMTKDDIIRCPSCTRILILDDKLEI